MFGYHFFLVVARTKLCLVVSSHFFIAEAGELFLLVKYQKTEFGSNAFNFSYYF